MSIRHSLALPPANHSRTGNRLEARVGGLLKRTLLFLAPLVARVSLAQTCPGAWSPLFELTSEGRPVYVERGVVTALGDRTLILGSPTLFWLTPTAVVPHDWKPGAAIDTAAVRWSLTRAGALVDLKGIAEAVPPVDTLVMRAQPRLIGWTSGRVDIAWKVADPVQSVRAVDSTGRRVEPVYTRVEHTTFDGVRWSPPEVIVRGRVDEILAPPSVRAGTAFEEGVFAITTEGRGEKEIRVGVRRAGRWITATWRDPARFFITDPIAFRTMDGAVALVYRASDRDGARLLSTQVERWIGDSAIWSPPVTAAIIGSSGGFLTPTAAHLGGDSVIVGWHQTDAGMVSALSVDGGRNWKALPVIAGVTTDGLRFVVDGRGLLHAVYRASSDPAVLNSDGVIAETAFRNGAWTPPSAVSGPSETAVSAGTTANGGILVLGTSAVLYPTGPEPKSWGRMWAPSCR